MWTLTQHYHNGEQSYTEWLREFTGTCVHQEVNIHRCRYAVFSYIEFFTKQQLNRCSKSAVVCSDIGSGRVTTIPTCSHLHPDRGERAYAPTQKSLLWVKWGETRIKEHLKARREVRRNYPSCVDRRRAKIPIPSARSRQGSSLKGLSLCCSRYNHPILQRQTCSAQQLSDKIQARWTWPYWGRGLGVGRCCEDGGEDGVGMDQQFVSSTLLWPPSESLSLRLNHNYSPFTFHSFCTVHAILILLYFPLFLCFIGEDFHVSGHFCLLVCLLLGVWKYHLFISRYCTML